MNQNLINDIRDGKRTVDLAKIQDYVELAQQGLIELKLECMGKMQFLIEHLLISNFDSRHNREDFKANRVLFDNGEYYIHYNLYLYNHNYLSDTMISTLFVFKEKKQNHIIVLKRVSNDFGGIYVDKNEDCYIIMGNNGKGILYKLKPIFMNLIQKISINDITSDPSDRIRIFTDWFFLFTDQKVCISRLTETESIQYLTALKDCFYKKRKSYLISYPIVDWFYVTKAISLFEQCLIRENFELIDACKEIFQFLLPKLNSQLTSQYKPYLETLGLKIQLNEENVILL
jgi:hypothetical protein